MGKKQIRVTNPETRAGEFLNRMISLVLSDNTVITGTLKKVENGSMLIQNMRLKKTTVSINKVAEFYTDIDA